jgi:hypothetical protein
VSDLEGLSVEMGTLYDAAAARSGTAATPATPAAKPSTTPATTAAPPVEAPVVSSIAAAPVQNGTEPIVEVAPAGGEDLDGARLVALNMALNGDSREAADRYLAENFDVADRERLLDEVYAAIEG